MMSAKSPAPDFQNAARRTRESFLFQEHPLSVTLILPPSVEKSLSPERAALPLAIGLFVSEEATLGQAAQIAGLPQTAFLLELGKRRIPIHYGPEELAEDLRAIDELCRK
jgi:predicted HTH domain antitoxin